MKITTVFKAPQEPEPQSKTVETVEVAKQPKVVKVKQVFKTQTHTQKELKQQWQVWEYKQEKKTNYDNHYIYRLATYSQANILHKEQLNKVENNPYRWRLYKRVKKIQKTLA